MLFHIFNRVVRPFSEKIIIIHNQEYTKITLLFKTKNNYCIITFVINFVILYDYMIRVQVTAVRDDLWETIIILLLWDLRTPLDTF